MAKRTILVDSARRELEKHGTETFPMTVNHDDLWSFEGKNVPIHWHNAVSYTHLSPVSLRRWNPVIHLRKFPG